MPMRWSLSLYRVFIVILNGSGLVLLRLFGAGQAVHGHLHSPDEIDLLIADSADGGLLEPDEQKRLREALRLGRRTARELMTPRRLVHMLRADASFETNVAEAISSPYTRLPVYHESEDNVVGFVHLRDLTAHFAETNGAGTLDAVLRPLPNVPASLPIEKLLPILRQRGQRLALVRDEYGGLEGIVTLQDVLNEILGTPPEEAQRWQPPPERLADGRFRLPGLLRLDEVATLTGTPLTSTEVTTLGGLLLEKLGRLPQPGERVLLGDLEVEVEAMDHQAVVSVLAEPQRSDSG
jgi:CBS domain containing-hemolysin-like protein